MSRNQNPTPPPNTEPGQPINHMGTTLYYRLHDGQLSQESQPLTPPEAQESVPALLGLRRFVLAARRAWTADTVHQSDRKAELVESTIKGVMPEIEPNSWSEHWATRRASREKDEIRQHVVDARLLADNQGITNTKGKKVRQTSDIGDPEALKKRHQDEEASRKRRKSERKAGRRFRGHNKEVEKIRDRYDFIDHPEDVTLGDIMPRLGLIQRRRTEARYVDWRAARAPERVERMDERLAELRRLQTIKDRRTHSPTRQTITPTRRTGR